jgi:methionyl aminopeptidase
MDRNNIIPKSKEEIETMKEGRKLLSEVKKELIDNVKKGASAEEIDSLAESLIEKTGGKPSFKMVENYSWTTCVNINEGVVHGIPKKSIIFKAGDVVSVDVGLYYKDFHTDTSFTVAINPDEKTEEFLEMGKKALKNGISQALIGNRIYDISKAIEDTLKKGKSSPIRALVGHGIGKKLHEAPQIPCFVSGKREDTPQIPEGATFAIEVMYTMGSSELGLDEDGWTISTQDGKIASLFEETVAVIGNGPLVLTEIST